MTSSVKPVTGSSSGRCAERCDSRNRKPFLDWGVFTWRHRPQPVVFRVMVEDYPRTLMELERRFHDEQACAEYLTRLLWPSGWRCSRCQGREAWQVGGIAGGAGVAGMKYRSRRAPSFRTATFCWGLGFEPCGMSPTRRTASAPWDCSVRWVWAATKPLGRFCTSCVEPWSGQAATG